MRYQSLFISLSVVCLLLIMLIPGTTAAAPVAKFNANRTYGAVPLTVSFTDASSDNPAGWAWYFGDELYNAHWTQMNVSPGWEHFYHSSVALPDGSIILMGGYDGWGTYYNDVWKSPDKGATWTKVNASAGWTRRQGLTSVVLPDGSIVLMGGWDVGGYPTNDVWRSTDKGATWTEQNAAAAWAPRYRHTSVVLPDGSIVLMGGNDGSSYRNDVWRSTDKGVTWVQQTANIGWSVRERHSGVVLLDGSILLMGGTAPTGMGGTYYYNDVWRSPDKGTTWTRLPDAGWDGRWGHSTVVMPDGSIVLTGGCRGSFGEKSDVWRSTDNGYTWTLTSSYPGWPAQAAHTSVVLPDGNIVQMGGLFNVNVWRLITSGSSAQNPLHIYTNPGTYNVALQAYNAGGYNSTRKTGYISVSNPAILSDRIGVFRNSTHQFYLDYNGNGVWNKGVVDRTYNFGMTGDIPLSGDWDNNGAAEIGVFRNSTHQFYLDSNGNGEWNGAAVDRQYNFGISGDIPISGDWDNNRKSEIGVFRPSTHLFYLDYNGNGVWNGAVVDRMYNFGMTGDIPISNDWNSDGRTEIGIFRPSTHQFYLDYNGNGVWNGAVVDRTYNFGITGDMPISGDWNHNGAAEIGVFRDSTHLFVLDYNGNGVWNGTVVDKTYDFGITGDTPVTGKWS